MHLDLTFCSYRWTYKARLTTLVVLALGLTGFCARTTRAQEPPYFVTYSDALEEPGNLEVAIKTAHGTPKYGNSFRGATLELEYGAKGWWTTEVYLSGQTTQNDSTVFTGFRWENRVRPFMRDHFINPVLYMEYEDVNGADRSFLEITGHHGVSDLLLTNAQGRQTVERAIELKLILSSTVKGWNVSENFIAEKNLSNEPWEFGYALGTSRPLAFQASAQPCVFCRQNFAVGAEMYGGLGDRYSFGWKQTSQYLAPTVSFDIPKGPTLTFSPSFGLNGNSVGVIYRFKVSYEIQQIFSRHHKGAN
jgi:hypothetical protein